MKKKLAISKESLLTAYPHYVNISSVLLDDRIDEPFNLWLSDIKTTQTSMNHTWFEKQIMQCNDHYVIDEDRTSVVLSNLNKISCDEGDITGCNDSFKYIYTELNGDGSIEIEIKHLKNTSVWAKAGLMFRENLYSDSRYISILATPSVNGIVIQMREESGKESNFEYICSSQFPACMKIERIGEYVQVSCGFSNEEWEYTRKIDFKFEADHSYMGISVCSPVNNAYLNWLATNFIQLYCYKDFDIHAIPLNYNAGLYLNDDFYSFCPYLRVQNIKYSLLKKNNISITKFIIEALNDDNYVDVYLNEYYVPQGKGYGKYDYYHGNMIYGYDLQTEIFNIVGYDENSLVRHSEITFKQFEKAIIEDGREGWYRTGLLSIFKLHPYFTYTFNVKLMITQLEDYINSKNSLNGFYLMENEDSRVVHGISVYDYLKENITNFQRDVRPLHVIWEHKKMMLIRLNYLKFHNLINNNDFEFLYSEYSSIERIAVQTRNLQLKNNLGSKMNYMELIKKNIEIIKSREMNTIPILIEACRKN